VFESMYILKEKGGEIEEFESHLLEISKITQGEVDQKDLSDALLAL
jgi:hypothetical protein